MLPLASPLLTDLYQLTMLQAYYEREMTQTAVFELFVRKLPAGRDFLIAAGLEQALDFAEGLAFGAEELEHRGLRHAALVVRLQHGELVEVGEQRARQGEHRFEPYGRRAAGI